MAYFTLYLIATKKKMEKIKHLTNFLSATYTQSLGPTLLNRWEQDENWGISVDDSSSLVSSSSEPRCRYRSERAVGGRGTCRCNGCEDGGMMWGGCPRRGGAGGLPGQWP